MQTPLRSRPLARLCTFALGRYRTYKRGDNLLLRRLPFCEKGANDHRIDDPHDLVPIGVVGAELGTLVGVEAPLEERPEDRRVYLRPVERRCSERCFDPYLVEREGAVVVEESAVEPSHLLESDPPSCRHRAEQISSENFEFLWAGAGVLEHPGEHVVREQADILGEHAEDESVHEVCDCLRIVALFA